MVVALCEECLAALLWPQPPFLLLFCRPSDIPTVVAAGIIAALACLLEPRSL
jgi:hypothetical protein